MEKVFAALADKNRRKIVEKKKQGKYRILTLNRNALKASFEWISYFSGFWNESFDQLEDLINQKNKDEQHK